MRISFCFCQNLFLFIALSIAAVLVRAQNPAGEPLELGNEVNDQRAGSILIYNYYTSNTTGTQNTWISLTNTNDATGVWVRMYFVAGGTGQSIPVSIPLTPSQTRTFSVSEIDPNTTGYIIAIASNEDGAPLQFNYLIGSAVITLATGHQATLGALAVPANANGSYAALPRQLALDQVPSPIDSSKRQLVVNRMDGNLSSMAGLGTVQGDFFNDQGGILSFARGTFGPQARVFADNLFTSPVFWAAFLPAGHYGWLRLRPSTEGAITGAVLYLQLTRGLNAPVPGSYNLRHLTNTWTAMQIGNATLTFGY